jgi:AcrR family transcriptional regulator
MNSLRTSPTWLGQPATDRRTAVLAAAQDVFATEGYYEAEVQTIARQTGIGKATIYKIFGSKKGILEAMLADMADHLVVILLGKFVGIESPMHRLREGAFAMLQFVEDNRNLVWTLLRDAGPSLERVAETYHQFLDRMEIVLAPVLAAERERGYFRGLSDRQTLEIAMSQLIGLAYKWLLVKGEKGALLEEGRVIIDLMIGYREDEKVVETAS